jgi:hypothetical protein
MRLNNRDSPPSLAPFSVSTSPFFVLVDALANMGSYGKHDTIAAKVYIPVIEDCPTIQAQAIALYCNAPAHTSLWDITLHVGTRQIKQHLTIDALSMPKGGGWRYYVRCDCGRLCAKLYLKPASNRFTCRRCAGLLYTRQRTRRRIQ